MPAYNFKPRFVAAIRVGLGQQIHHEPGGSHVYHPKQQTIRAVGKRRHARPGEVLQLYTGMRTKQCKSIGVAKCTSVRPITITFGKLSGVTIGGPIEGFYDEKDLDAFARRDGFSGWSDMVKFWSEEHGTKVFVGLLIEWEQIR